MKILVLFLLIFTLGAKAEIVRQPRMFTVKGKTGPGQIYTVSCTPPEDFASPGVADRRA